MINIWYTHVYVIENKDFWDPFFGVEVIKILFWIILVGPSFYKTANVPSPNDAKSAVLRKLGSTNIIRKKILLYIAIHVNLKRLFKGHYITYYLNNIFWGYIWLMIWQLSYFTPCTNPKSFLKIARKNLATI